MTRQTVFDSEGLDLGNSGRNLVYLYGLSDFWSFIFEDSEKIELLLEATSQRLSDIYSTFLQLTSTLSLEDIQVFSNQQIKLVVLKTTDFVQGKVNTYKLPDTIISTKFIANRPLLPTTLLEDKVHYRISDDGKEIQFFNTMSGMGFPVRILEDGTQEWAMWFVDVAIDEQFVSDHFAKLLQVVPEVSTENFKNFVNGLYFLFTNGPNLSLIRKGLNLALGIPLARETETVLEIRKYLDTDQFLVITDLNQYLVPFGLSPSVSVGDVLVATQELAQWVEVKDWINDGDWWINLGIPIPIMPYLPAGETSRFATVGSYADYLMRTFLKKHTFLVNVKTVDFKNLQTLHNYHLVINQAKPKYTYPIYVWTIPTLDDDELDIVEEDPSLSWSDHRCEDMTMPTEKMVRLPAYFSFIGSDLGVDIVKSENNLLALSGTSIEVARATQSLTRETYWEAGVESIYGDVRIGIAKSTSSLSAALGTDANSWVYRQDGQKVNNGVASAYGATFTTADIIGVNYVPSTGALTFYKNGISQGLAFTGITGTVFPAVSLQGRSTGPFITDTSTRVRVNLGNYPFTGTPPATATDGVYLDAPPLYRDCSFFTRDSVSHFTYGQLGNSMQINGDPLTFDTGIVAGYVNSVRQLRMNTRQEDAWIRTVVTRNHMSYTKPRSTMLFIRGEPIPAIEGVGVNQFQATDTQRVVFLYSTTQQGVHDKYQDIGGNEPGLSTWSWTLFQPYRTVTPINVGAVDNEVTGSDATGLLAAHYSTFMLRGIYRYLGIFMPSVGYQTFTPQVTDIRTGDYLMFIRIYESAVGVYWVTSNFDLNVPSVKLIEKDDPITISSDNSHLRYGLAPYSSYYLLRGAGGTITFGVGGPVDAGPVDTISVDGTSSSMTSSVDRIYSDQVNQPAIHMTRADIVLKFRRDFK
jgi:hypothetical protein